MPVGARMLSAGVLLAAWLCAQSPLRNTGFVEGEPAAGRAEVPAPNAAPMVEVQRPDHTAAHRPITPPERNNYELAGAGMDLEGPGAASFDDVTSAADAQEPAPPLTGAARPLTAHGLENLSALARMFGFVRYFHPSDEASAADWNRFAVAAVLAVEPAAAPTELASTLERIFAPVAPRVRVLVAGAPRPMMEMQSGAYVTLWQHRGLGPPQGRAGTPYYSMRFLVPAEQAPLVAFAPFRADLPGGVSCMIPLALYRPAGPVAQVRPLPAPGGSPNDRATRLAAVIVAWNVFENFYPYLDDLGPVWMGALGRLLSEAAEDRDAVAFHATLNKMAVILRDGRFAIDGPGAPPDYVPPVVWTMAEGHITALSSQAADVKPGDVLISIDGKPAAEVLAAREAITPGSTPQSIRDRALASLLARAPSEKVQVELEPAAQVGTHRAVALECGVRAAELHPPRPDKIAEVEPGIFYLDLNRVTDADFAAALPALSKARGIVYDLRGPEMLPQLFPFLGRLLTRAVQGPPTAAPLVTRPDGAETIFQENPWMMSAAPPFLATKRAFLAGGRTLGPAETILAIAERNRLGEIVGEASGGDNGALNSFTLPGGYELTWTAERVRQYDGSPLFGIGIRPTIPVSPARAGIAAGHDEVLERGLQAVK